MSDRTRTTTIWPNAQRPDNCTNGAGLPCQPGGFMIQLSSNPYLVRHNMNLQWQNDHDFGACDDEYHTLI